MHFTIPTALLLIPRQIFILPSPVTFPFTNSYQFTGIRGNNIEFIVLFFCKIFYVIKNRENNKLASWEQISRPKYLASIYATEFNSPDIEYLEYVCSGRCSMAIPLDNFAFRYKWFSVTGKTCS
jgi:hypothetical protein